MGTRVCIVTPAICLYNHRIMMRELIRRGIPAGTLLLLLCSVLAGCIFPGVNYPPVAELSALPFEGYQPLTVRFDASDSFDPNGDALIYSWDFGDGTTGTGVAPDHTYDQAGTFTVHVDVTDTRGATDRATATVTSRAIPSGFLVTRLEWKREGEDRVWDALVPEGLYLEYGGRARIPFVNTHLYGEYVSEPLDDPTFEDLAAVLWNLVGQTEEEFILEALALVQGAIQYQSDGTGLDYPLYPLETLVDGKGDCEDTAILYVSLLQARDIPCKLAFVDTDGDGTPDHVLALVAASNQLLAQLSCSNGVAMFVWESVPYVVAETAVDRGVYALGCDPWELEESDLMEIWSF